MSEVDSTGQSAGDKFASTFGRAVKGIGAGIAVGVGAAIGAVAAVAGKGLSRALNLQDAKAQLKGLGHDAEGVEKIMVSALDSVTGTAFGLDKAATIAASAVAAGVKPGEALTRTLKLTADAATIGKSSLSEMGDMVNKVATNGKLSTEVLNQFQGRGIPLLQLVADQYGITAEAASEMVTKGEVDFAAFQTALEKGVGGAALSSGATARGAFANIGASFGRLGAMFTGSSVDAAPALFVSIAGAVDRLSDSLAPLAEKFNGKVTPAVAALSAWIDGIDFNAVAANVSGAFSAISGAFSKVVGAFQSGDFSTLGESFGNISSILQPMLPIFIEVGRGIGGIAGTVGELIAAGIPLLVPILQSFTDILGWIGDNSQIVTPIILALAAGFAIYRAAQVASIGAAIISLPLTALQVVADLARTRALVANTNAMNVQRAAEGAGMLVRTPATASILASAAASIAHRVATAAMGIAQKAAAAAQWLLNAAMSANPIALVVIAIAALVAGLIWFFTQTELGQAIWSNFTKFLGEAWANISATAMAIFQALGAFFSGFWEGVKAFFTGAIAVIIALFLNWTPLGIIIKNFSGIVGFFTGLWSNITSSVSSGVSNVVRFFTEMPGRVMSALGNLGNLLKNSGQALIQGFLNGISSMIGKIGDVIGGVMDFVGGFFPHSPAKRGPFSGSGWRAIGDSGKAVIDEFQSGIPADALRLNGSFAAKMTSTSRGSVAGGTASSAAAIYVQNPFTGEYLLAQVGSVADGRIQVKDSADERVTSGRRRAN
ncbi:tape measure protein [Cryobacterium psychrophilum]|uniref:tape measure protein n=1 Tax=Cryobacterium psychrophilum TaxID=41988 RepID=UPI0014170F35|nr:tape measure protein [Cryobacterium psychrophilum]